MPNDRSPIRPLAAVAGVVLLLAGILGFVPGVTTHDGDLSSAGHTSGAKLLGIFQVSILHNIVHLLIGVVGVVLARTAAGAEAFILGGGVACLALWVRGAAGAGSWLPTNTADSWLHLLLGIALIGLGFVCDRSPARAAV